MKTAVCALVLGLLVPEPLFAKAEKRPLEVVREAVKSSDASVRETAVKVLSDAPVSDAESILKPLLSDANVYVRVAAARALFKRGSMAGVPALKAVLEDVPRSSEDSPVLAQLQNVAAARKRAAAAVALGDSPDRAISHLLETARASDPDPSVRDAASVALAKLGDATELVVFRSALRDDDEGVRKAAMDALSQAGGPGDQTIFLRGLEDASPGVRMAALDGLTRIKAKGPWREIAALTRDPEAEVRGRAAAALAAAEAKGAIPALKTLLEDENGVVRIQAAGAMARLGDAGGLDFLLATADAQDRDVRRYVVEALSAFPDKKAKDALVARLQDGDESVRLAAAAALLNQR